jgi:outer membrane protein OmpA-like peptidoglycan-associated protein
MIVLTAPSTHADGRKNTAEIPARHHEVVSRAENLDGTERTVDQDNHVTYGLQAEVLFAKNSAALTGAAQSRLTRIAAKIARSRTTRPVTVNGYTDDLGSAEHGLDLSRKRAKAVLQALEKDPRLPNTLFIARGYGEKDPIASNETEHGRAKNRRVEVVVTRS